MLNLLKCIYEQYMIDHDYTNSFECLMRYKYITGALYNDRYDNWIYNNYAGYTQDPDGYKEWLFDNTIIQQESTEQIPIEPFCIKIGRCFYFCNNYQFKLSIWKNECGSQYFCYRNYEDTSKNDNHYKDLCIALEGHIIEAESFEEITKKYKLIKKEECFEIYDILQLQ